SGSAVSGLVIQKVNVRNGPGTGYELLGVLNSNDVVFITGKDPGGAWIQIEFASAPDGKGWVTAEFLQVGNIEAVPLIGDAADETVIQTDATPNAISVSAMQDGDSMQAPLAVAFFSPTDSRALQVNGDVSAPDGDVEDWVQFTTTGEVVAIQVTCSSNTLRVELWKDEKPVDDLACGDKSFVTVASNSSYFLRLSESSANEPGYTKYILSVESIH
ncbi:MAG: SH3 domain-containing protein, partial [Anaerolineales bacterium]|nr:SH3 domain-containing protein [Anaerolineales bacterium]